MPTILGSVWAAQAASIGAAIIVFLAVVASFGLGRQWERRVQRRVPGGVVGVRRSARLARADPELAPCSEAARPGGEGSLPERGVSGGVQGSSRGVDPAGGVEWSLSDDEQTRPFVPAELFEQYRVDSQPTKRVRSASPPPLDWGAGPDQEQERTGVTAAVGAALRVSKRAIEEAPTTAYEPNIRREFSPFAARRKRARESGGLG